jgi:hypothetical protein
LASPRNRRREVSARWQSTTYTTSARFDDPRRSPDGKKSLGVANELVIYPGERHRVSTPTYRIDRLERYVAWYEKY